MYKLSFGRHYINNNQWWVGITRASGVLGTSISLVAILEPLFAFGSIWLFGTLILFVSQKHENLHHAKIPTSNYTVPLDST